MRGGFPDTTTQPALIGRARETASLERARGAARRRRGGMLLVAGEAGVAKTALVEHAVGRSGQVVLRGTARPAGNTPPAPLLGHLTRADASPRPRALRAIEWDHDSARDERPASSSVRSAASAAPAPT